MTPTLDEELGRADGGAITDHDYGPPMSLMLS